MTLPEAAARIEAARRRHAAGDVEGAIAELAEALRIDPAAAAAHQNLALLLAQAGRAGEALAALERAVAQVPGDSALWARLARAQAHAGNAAASIASVRRAALAGPADAVTWAMIGGQLAEYALWGEARAALAEAARLDPGEPQIELLLAHALHELGDDAGALEALARGTERAPANLNVAVDEALLLPHCYASADDVGRWRERYTNGMLRLLGASARWLESAAQVLDLNHHNFLLAYQGEDDRELQHLYASFLARLLGRACPQWRVARAATFDGGRRLRVGFVGGVFHDCTAGRYFERWITKLDPRRFERRVYQTAPVADATTARIRAAADAFTVLRAGAADAAARLHGEGLDVIVYPEVGMTPTSYLLAGLRLAPLQCAAWGHPVTTGSEAIDLYFTSAAMEPPGGAAHYVERLVALPGLGVDYAMPEAPAAGERRDFSLPAEGRLYVCPQSLFKVHPEMDALFADVLEADPGAVLVFFQAPSRAVTEQFAARLQRTLGARGLAPRGQLKFLPRMPGGAFRRVLALADVVLDTVRWSGGNTSLDAFSVATPVVTLPGRFMRGRQTAAMLEMMGIERLVARDRADYVRIALEVARDRDTNAGLREAIVRGREALFDRPEPIAALADALLEAAGKR